jgi:hypothetical protein
VVQLAQRKPVLDHRLALRVRVGKNVGGVEQFLMPEAADGADTPIFAKACE